MRSKDCVSLIGYGTSVVIVFVIWICLFVLLSLPEIKEHTEYEPAICNVTATDVLKNFCCQKSCSYCSEAVSTAPSCSASSRLSETYDVDKCNNGTGTCPYEGTCNDGYHCCSECCQTCTSCSTSCSSSGSCSQSCTSYQCNCYCCNSVSNHQCTLTCPTCYTAVLTLEVERVGYDGIPDGDIFNSSYSEYFKFDEQAARDFAASYNRTRGTAFPCFVSEKSIDVILDRGYTAGYWGATGTFTVILYLLIGGAFCALGYAWQQKLGLVVFSSIWFGLFTAIAIFVPIFHAGIMSEASRTCVFFFLMIFAAVAVCIPAVHCMNETTKYPLALTVGFTVVFLFLPIGIFIPLGVRVLENVSMCIALVVSFIATYAIIWIAPIVYKRTQRQSAYKDQSFTNSNALNIDASTSNLTNTSTTLAKPPLYNEPTLQTKEDCYSVEGSSTSESSDSDDDSDCAVAAESDDLPPYTEPTPPNHQAPESLLFSVE